MYTFVNKMLSMANRKTVPLSVRVSDSDAAFLASLEIAGAATPSEKLRALLGHARQRAEGVTDEADGVEAYRTPLRTIQRQVRNSEIALGVRSDLVRKLLDRLPELMGSLANGPGAESTKTKLAQYEDRLAIQAYALVEELLELALASENRAYDPARLSKRVTAALGVVDRINAPIERKKEVKS